VRVTGVVSAEKLKELGYIPSKQRLLKGPVAIFECVEPIPCNVCVFSCPFKAVVMDKITDMPKVDFSKCTGCGLCVAQCPGQAIFVVDYSPNGGIGYLTLQYDLTQPPNEGEDVILLDRKGKELGKGRVLKVYKHKRSEAFVVTIEMPKEFLMSARAIKVQR
jgi:Fe-S-cluster-containing hydrogenase component 2